MLSIHTMSLSLISNFNCISSGVLRHIALLDFVFRLVSLFVLLKKIVKQSLFNFRSHPGFISIGTLDEKMTRKGKANQQKDEEEDIEKNLNSTFFSNTSFKTRATNNME